MFLRLSIGAAALAAVAVPATAQQQQQERPPVLTRVVQCRTIASTAERLACYDREVAAMDAAEASRELVVMDRQQVRRARRSLFGLSLPDLGIFGGDEESDEESARIESTVRSASQTGNGKWIIVLADGARWLQVDSRNLAIEPRPGHSIRIRRALMGSYLANVNGQVAIRVRRVN